MSKLDDILGTASDWCGCYEGDMTDQFEDNEPKAKEEIKALFLEIIGRDENESNSMEDSYGQTKRNYLRMELRKEINKL